MTEEIILDPKTIGDITHRLIKIGNIYFTSTSNSSEEISLTSPGALNSLIPFKDEKSARAAFSRLGTSN